MWLDIGPSVDGHYKKPFNSAKIRLRYDVNWLLVVIILGFKEEALAVVSCYQPAIPQIAGPKAVVDQVLKIAIIGDEDRRTLKDFAKDSGESERVISQRYSASGELKCDDWVTQASVVSKGDLILVSGHGIYKSKDCEKAYDLKDC